MTSKVVLDTSISRSSSMARISFWFVGISVVCTLFADISITTLDPWGEFSRMAKGALAPDFLAVADIGFVIVQTVAFAFCGVALGAVGAGVGVGGGCTVSLASLLVATASFPSLALPRSQRLQLVCPIVLLVSIVMSSRPP